MKNKILIAATLFTSAFILQSCDNQDNKSGKKEKDTSQQMVQPETTGMNKMDNGMMQSMDSMMSRMNNLTVTGNYDHNFASMMIIHHQAAIDMSNEEISKGHDEQIKTMAQNIITSQKAEIEQLQPFVKDNNKPEAKKRKAQTNNTMAGAMKANMDKINAMQMTGNTDKDFVMMMIPHHESAVTMAQDEISNGKKEKLKKMATKMVDEQNKEITELKAWLDNQK